MSCMSRMHRPLKKHKGPSLVVALLLLLRLLPLLGVVRSGVVRVGTVVVKVE